MQILRKGSIGSEVEMLQLGLERAGFYDQKIDGIFGSYTESSVKRFQSANRLTADGIVGRLTLNALSPYLKGYTSHVVVRGDTFWRLAGKYGTTIEAIRTANPNINQFNLTIGSRLIIPFGFSVVPTNISYSSALTRYICEGLSVIYPFVNNSTIGQSEMGQSLNLLSIGRGNTEFFYGAAFHANEWITTPVLLKFIEEYAKAYSENKEIFGVNANALFETTKLYIVPLVNPDGVDLATKALTEGRFYNQAVKYANDYPNIPFPDGWKANINGVDLNLQFPAGWENAKEIKFSQGYVSPAPRDYVGAAPLNQKESKAVYNFTLRNNFRLILAYHTQGEIIYWKYDDFNPENSYNIGREFERVSGYVLENTPYSSGFAGYKDWFIQNYNLPGYTIECGLGSNPLPISQFDKIYSDNLGILVTALLQKI